MADNANEKTVKGIAAFIEEHNGQDTVVLNISELNSWTDYFIIATVTSSGHLRGLLNQLYQKLDEEKIVLLHHHKKADDERWVLLDCGFFVIHLMNQEAREFYNLEKLWFNGEKIEFK